MISTLAYNIQGGMLSFWYALDDSILFIPLIMAFSGTKLKEKLFGINFFLIYANTFINM